MNVIIIQWWYKFCQFAAQPPRSVKIVGLALILSILAIAFYCLCKRKRNRDASSVQHEDAQDIPNSLTMLTLEPSTKSNHRSQKRRLFEQDNERLLKKFIGILRHPLGPSVPKKLRYSDETNNNMETV